MKTFTYNVTQYSLKKTIPADEYYEINNAKAILIQLFSGEHSARIEQLLHEIKRAFPTATIIGATTDGEIAGSTVTIKNSILSISIFEYTNIKSFYTDIEDDFEAGTLIAKQLVTDKSKLLISFADGLLTNGEEYLNGIYSISPTLMVAGGLSGDNAEFKECYIIHNDIIYMKGAVAVVLDSDILKVQNFYNFGWDRIGIEHTITHVEKNRVFTIDDMSTVEFYKKYLGEEIANELPATAVEFPLIKIDSINIDVARAALKKFEDGSLSFAGNFKNGDKISLGVGNSNKILSYNIDNSIENLSVESFFIYSCMARRRFMLNLTEKELQPYSNIATTSGFFTYGEFYTQKRPLLLNETLTAISLSENSDKKFKLTTDIDKKTLLSSQYKTYRAISHLINQTVKEYNVIQKKLEHRVYIEQLNSLDSRSKYQLLIDSMSEGMIICDDNYKITDMNSATLSLLGYSREELLSTKIIDYSSDKSFQDMIECIQSDNNKRFEITLVRKDSSVIFALMGQKTIELRGKIIHMAIIVDISEIVEKDKQLLIQSRFAQMGEMINMIAHQWRQPLNIISASAIELNMKNQLGLLKTNDISNTMEFIQNATQKMSQTINDFMNFSKRESEESSVVLNTFFQEVLSLIDAQLTSHDIEVEIINKENLTLMTKKQELSHILINLLVNARDALNESMQEKKKITISAYMKEGKCYIDILDNAGGISDKIINKVFELYFTTKEQGKGTGLGLYMSKKMAHDFLDADIKVKNRKEGAEFSIIFNRCLVH